MADQEPDPQLLQRASLGDEAAFTLLYRRHKDAVYRFALMLCGLPALAADAAQEAFLLLVHTPERYDATRGPLRAFLMGVARNHVRRGRDDAPPPMITQDEDEAEPEANDVGHDWTPLAALVEGETLTQLHDAILRLPFAYREALVLCDLQELPYQDAAAIIGCPIGTVRSRLNRARQQLTRTLTGRIDRHGLEISA